MSIGPLGGDGNSIPSSNKDRDQLGENTGFLGEHVVSTKSGKNLETLESNTSNASSSAIDSQKEEKKGKKSSHSIVEGAEGSPSVKHVIGPEGDIYAVISKDGHENKGTKEESLQSGNEESFDPETEPLYASPNSLLAMSSSAGTLRFEEKFIELENVVSGSKEEINDDEKSSVTWRGAGEGFKVAVDSIRLAIQGVNIKGSIEKSAKKLKSSLDKTFKKTETKKTTESKSLCNELRVLLKKIMARIKQLFQLLIRKSRSLFKDKSLEKVVKETEKEAADLESKLDKGRLSLNGSQGIFSLQNKIDNIFQSLNSFFVSLFRKAPQISFSTQTIGTATQTAEASTQTEETARNSSLMMQERVLTEQLLQELKEKLNERRKSQ